MKRPTSNGTAGLHHKMPKERGMPKEWADFPKRKNKQGCWLCRFCGKVLTGRRTSWCSRQCTIEVLLLCDWSFIRNKVKRRDKYRCVLCHRNKWEAGSLEVDHIVELSEFGLSVMDNLRVLCKTCHLEKTLFVRKLRKAGGMNGFSKQHIRQLVLAWKPKNETNYR